MNKIKEWLLTALGGFGHLLYLVISVIPAVINLLPMLILDFPWWLYILISLILWFIPLAQLPYLGIWIWAFVVVLGRPMNWLSIVFIVAFVLYFGYMILNLLSSVGSKSNR